MERHAPLPPVGETACRIRLLPAPDDAGAPSNWLLFAAQVLLVACVELFDDGLHALTGRSNARLGVLDALRLVHFEQLHDLWLEPAVQRFFEQSHGLLGLTISWVQLMPVFALIYGPCHVLVTLAFAIWIYQCRRHLFAFLRNVFLITNALAVLLYEIFPTAPPRLTPMLRFDGNAFHFTDVVFGAASWLKIGFNQYAAMPSIHVAWAVIVGAGMVCTAQPLGIRLAAPLWPALMLLTVVVTGNHYFSDAAGALVVLAVAGILALQIERRHGRPWLRRSRHSRRFAWRHEGLDRS